MEPAQSEMNILSNGKSHDLGDDMGFPMKTLLEEDQFDDPDGGLENEEFLPSSDGKKPMRFTDFEGKTSFGMSVFNLGNAIMGSGILGLAYAMANTGILLFLFLLTAVAALSSYSIHLLLKSSGIVGIRAYEQLGYRAFGTPGKMAAGIAITLQNIGAMSSYLYIVKSELPLVIQAFLKADPNSEAQKLCSRVKGLVDFVGSEYSVVLEWKLPGHHGLCQYHPALALMKQLGELLGYTSGFSLSCMVFFLSAVIYKKFQIPCPFEEFSANSTAAHLSVNVSSHGHEYNNGLVHTGDDDSHCSPHMFTINSQTAYTIPILAFAFVCHPEVLPIYTELRNPTKKKMQKVSNISIFVMYTMYFLAALFGYLTFYDNVEPELLHTYSRIDPYDTLILCVRVAVLTAVTLTVPIVLFPVRRAIQQMLFPTKAFNWLRHIAIAVPRRLRASFSSSLLFYIRIVPKEDEPMSSVPKILAFCFAALGVSFMVMSLSFIFSDWISGSSRAAGGH
ncbi:hypothetical protein INR49_029695 [Caranx melampygus]|nr:hypothetical protein INR49_029695 [Caranx melampygus]